ncbi:NAD(P)H-dependent oxidoreductase [uncultured Anaerovibrio sp.]|uniref:NAD(P)H-dependent oxidoreductase n=1 Tax=uncultured Anaerovibrio sp. TaxID=361586 RepID=UPI0025EC6049|nr:NAD(P)H-dependent oxidoreductase [uncultured Anaerovibrio sp.]
MHALIINGSPRVKKYSNTDKIIEKFAAGLKGQGGTCEVYAISDRNSWDELREAFRTNNNIVIAMPLYVECVPGLLMEFLETLAPKEDDTQISFILQSGFAEGAQLRCGEAYLRMLPELLGCKYGGTLVKGDNFGIRFAQGKELDRMTEPYREMGRIFAMDGHFFSQECRNFTGVEVFPLPIKLLLMAFFRTVQRKMFQKVAKKWGCTKPLDYKPYKTN